MFQSQEFCVSGESTLLQILNFFTFELYFYVANLFLALKMETSSKFFTEIDKIRIKCDLVIFSG